jgi:hypothetical protein
MADPEAAISLNVTMFRKTRGALESFLSAHCAERKRIESNDNRAEGADRHPNAGSPTQRARPLQGGKDVAGYAVRTQSVLLICQAPLPSSSRTV